MRTHRRSRLGIALMAVVLTTAQACEPITAPTPVSQSPLARFEVSGVVTDEHGIPVPSASLTFNHLPTKGPGFTQTTTRSDASGAYSVAVDAITGLPLMRGPGIDNVLAFVAVWQASAVTSHDGDFQYVVAVRPPGAETVRVTKDFRMTRAKRIAPGESLTVTIDDRSPICSNNAQDYHPWPEEWICQNVRIVSPLAGVVTVTADGGTVQNPEAPFNRGQAIDLTVEAGKEAVACIEVPWTGARPVTIRVSVALK